MSTREQATAGATRLHYKDEILDEIAEQANVAQFVSFDPAREQRYSRVRGYPPNHRFETIEAAIEALIRQPPEFSVNVRSYDPASPKSREFVYGLTKPEEAAAHVRRLAADGLHTIVNETVDIHDGGVSGVTFGGLVEFAPEDTPRSVEKPGTLALPRELGLRLLETVYGFTPEVDFGDGIRVEFSVHPLRRGVQHEHTIVWELEALPRVELASEIVWPCRFSRFVGDKAFGLLLAHLLGLPVPHTLVLGRSLAPFSFGRRTGTGETWIRTCPREQVAGRYVTVFGWEDPFLLMAREDPDGEALASVLAQDGVQPEYSGAAVPSLDGELIVEGVSGRGDAFMQGNAPLATLPSPVLDAVRGLYDEAHAQLGPVRLEWVFDGARAWVVQMHRGATPSSGRTIFPGGPATFHPFDVSEGLEPLRALIARVAGTGDGILLIGEVGITSHFGDVLRKAQIPSRIEPATERSS